MYRLRYLLEEEAVAKEGMKSPESDRQAIGTTRSIHGDYLTGFPSSSSYHACKPALLPCLMASCACGRVTLAVAW